MTCCWLTGDPIANIKLLEDPGKNLVVIMKDGKVYKKRCDAADFRLWHKTDMLAHPPKSALGVKRTSRDVRL